MSQSEVSPMAVAIAYRCPRCGKGALYRRFHAFDLSLREECDN